MSTKIPESKTRTQLTNEIYDITKEQDLSIMYQVLWSVFKKRTINTMDNEQLKILIPELKKKYHK